MSERLISPYGLVAKAGVWHLVYAHNQAVHVHRVADYLDVRLADESFERPPDFDLASFWEGWCAAYETQLADFKVTVRVAPALVAQLPRHFGRTIHTRIAEAGPPDAAGWIRLELSFESFEAAREHLLGFGRDAEVLEPYALRRSVLDFAEQIVALYTGG